MVPFDTQPTLPYPTDTATPVTPIPIFYLHEGDHPFCLNAACLCHRNDGELKNLLLAVIERKLQLVEVQRGLIQWGGANADQK